jgi:hypothetical protein
VVRNGQIVQKQFLLAVGLVQQLLAAEVVEAAR